MTIEELKEEFPGEYPEFALSQKDNAQDILKAYSDIGEIYEDYLGLMNSEKVEDFKSCNDQVETVINRGYGINELLYFMYIFSVLNDTLEEFRNFLQNRGLSFTPSAPFYTEANLQYSIHTGANSFRRHRIPWGPEVQYRDYAYILGLSQKMDDWEFPHALFQHFLFNVDHKLKSSTVLEPGKKVLKMLQTLSPTFARYYDVEDEPDLCIVVKAPEKNQPALVYLLKKDGFIQDLKTLFPDQDISAIEKALTTV